MKELLSQRDRLLTNVTNPAEIKSLLHELCVQSRVKFIQIWFGLVLGFSVRLEAHQPLEGH